MAENKRQRDILKEKSEAIRKLARLSQNAVDMVTRTISSLENINQEIDQAVDEIDRYSEDLMKTRQEMSDQREHNKAIISNFSKLLVTE